MVELGFWVNRYPLEPMFESAVLSLPIYMRHNHVLSNKVVNVLCPHWQDSIKYWITVLNFQMFSKSWDSFCKLEKGHLKAVNNKYTHFLAQHLCLLPLPKLNSGERCQFYDYPHIFIYLSSYLWILEQRHSQTECIIQLLWNKNSLT